jgi:NAD(P)-dependent dehydrogenase (short-subunit alcohol dehydrogenase family)
VSTDLNGTDLNGKVAVITGASTGIGRAAAVVLAREGMRIVLAARRADRLDETLKTLTAAGHDAIAIACDVGDFAQTQALAEAALEAYGRADVVLLNAGIAGGGSLLDVDLEQWHASVDANLFGLIHGIKVFLPILMRQDEPGSLLATSSATGVHGISYNTAAYSTTKAAQLAVMEALYGQLRDAKSPVHVGVVMPPLTRTNLAGDDMAVWERVEKQLSGRPGAPALIEPEEFAEVILEGICDRVFWIETTEDQNARFYGGRDAGGPRRRQHLINARAKAMLERAAPDSYLW